MMNHQLPETGFVRLPVVLHLTGMGKSKIWQMAKEGNFPKPYKLAARVSAWKVEDLKTWIEAQVPQSGEANHAAQ